MPHRDVTFLLVEDDDVEIMVLKRSFEQLKIANNIIVAHDGIEALEALRGENDRVKISSPYIILLDLNMPRMNGHEFLAELRMDESLQKTIVFVLTTSSLETDRCKAYTRNVAGYFVKSNIHGLLDILGTYADHVEFPELSNVG